MIESLDESSDEAVFIQCEGNYLDRDLAEILKKTRFLACVLQQFLVFAYHANFELQIKFSDNNKVKRKLIKLMVNEINQKPVLDVALIVFMRSLLCRSLNHENARKMGTSKFGKEPGVKYFDKFNDLWELKLVILNLDDQNFDLNNDKTHGEKVNLSCWDSEFRIVYNKRKVQLLEKLNFETSSNKK